MGEVRRLSRASALAMTLRNHSARRARHARQPGWRSPLSPSPFSICCSLVGVAGVVWRVVVLAASYRGCSPVGTSLSSFPSLSQDATRFSVPACPKPSHPTKEERAPTFVPGFSPSPGARGKNIFEAVGIVAGSVVVGCLPGRFSPFQFLRTSWRSGKIARARARACRCVDYFCADHCESVRCRHVV